jgi:hypothetical protein
VQSSAALNRASSWQKNYQQATLARAGAGYLSTEPQAPLGQITRSFSREDKKNFIGRNLTYMGTAVRELLNVRES